MNRRKKEGKVTFIISVTSVITIHTLEAGSVVFAMGNIRVLSQRI
jgi:hypothetical protein